ncbi:aspartate/methionine/tyrosine aminotransferase [Saccharopolyspora lacisalsi]|uniref:Aspartate/methionine/tyrosine aminotransferase n=1 Tax=Halosaccharopolyspora lacisalsi TaxID=1000566 RepID=A0A839E1R4_9PSEU|nr:pyridoxal phosphate-dependent aminotransferase [Halosaccharopolyspora lacisalsi]MBA8827774.1 aspartate/methionine/tyrosine aminotransferase [Halosaccharopolyspora lacisalsi]
MGSAQLEHEEMDDAVQLRSEWGESLTRYEVIGLGEEFNFADGHAYHPMPAMYASVESRLTEIWRETASKNIRDLEVEFKDALARLICSDALRKSTSFSISPTASSSIDIVSAYLVSEGVRVGLITPAFDNLNLMMRRRGVHVTPIPEAEFVDLDRLRARVIEDRVGCVFLVSPNNPTGFRLSRAEFTDLCTLCAKLDRFLVVDLTFRFYAEEPYDEYDILRSSGVKYFTIEDTGKTWPTHDMKASLLAYSPEVASLTRQIYEEIFLCSSGFALSLFAELFHITRQEGVEKCILDEARRRRTQVDAALAGTKYQPASGRGAVVLPLAWLDCENSGLSDLEVSDGLRSTGIAVLPGRHFYWNHPSRSSNFIRLSLLRPDDVLRDGLEAIGRHLPMLSS